MLNLNPKGLLILSLLASSVISMVQAADINLAASATISASSYRGNYVANYVNDGVVSDGVPLAGGPGRPQAVGGTVVFTRRPRLGMVDVFSGWKNGLDSRQRDFDVLIEVNGSLEAPCTIGIFVRIRRASKRIYIEQVNVTKVRLELLRAGAARIREIAVYNNKEALGLQDVGEAAVQTRGLRYPLQPAPDRRESGRLLYRIVRSVSRRRCLRREPSSNFAHRASRRCCIYGCH